MALTARDRDTGRIIWPVAGATAECRDQACAARMHMVAAVLDRDTVLRVAHFRHSVSAERTCAPASEDRDYKTPWHASWQNLCDEPERVERRHQVGDRTRRADIWTRFAWAIEVQHSALAPATVRGRENHYSGKLLWLIDAASANAPCSVDQYRDSWRVTPAPQWIGHVRTVAAFDIGGRVLALPAGRSPSRWDRGGDLVIPERLCRLTTADEFTASWINGHTLPLPASTRTEWEQQRAEATRKARDTEQERRAATRAAAEDAYVCTFEGDRDRLLGPAQVEPPPPVPETLLNPWGLIPPTPAPMPALSPVTWLSGTPQNADPPRPAIPRPLSFSAQMLHGPRFWCEVCRGTHPIPARDYCADWGRE